MIIEDYGFKKNLERKVEKEIIARIIATYRGRYEIICDKGHAFAILKSASYYDNEEAIYPTIGDFVIIEWNDIGDSRIIETLERKSCFSRVDPSPDRKHEQLVAANFDYVCIMQSLNDNYNIHRLERYLTLAFKSGGVPVILLTKCDLVDDYNEKILEVENIQPGIDVIAISVKTGEGLDKLTKFFKKGNTLVFLGSSGVGKSSLVNKLAGEEVMITKEIREEDSRGRHTTTHRQLIMLSNGSMIIDTPGMRELGMWDAQKGIERTFSDVEKYLGKCKFSNCTHTNEPGCKIIEAIENGELSKQRYLSYIKLKKESEYIEDSENYLIEKKKKFKEISKYNRKNN